MSMSNKTIYILLILIILVSVSMEGRTILTNFAEGYAWPIELWNHHLNQPPVYFAEDFYQLYAQRNYYGEDEINLNIVFMQGALKSPFRLEHKALIPIHYPREHEKYRYLIRMHLNFRIMKDYLYLGRLYDMPELYYWHRRETKQLIRSMKFAKYYYQMSRNYWEEVKKWAVEAYAINDYFIDLDHLEDEMTFIVTRQIDWQFDRIINMNLAKVQHNLEKLHSTGEQDKGPWLSGEVPAPEPVKPYVSKPFE